MNAPRYAELQVTTQFSFLRGASSAEELFATAATMGIEALAVVDRNSLAGIVRAHEAAKATGIRLIVGCRLDLACGMSVLVYPIDREAYSRLCRLLTLGKGRAGKGRCHLEWADLVAYGEGLVAVLPERHRLASHAEVPIAELVGEPLVLFPAELMPGYLARITEALESGGATMDVVQRTANNRFFDPLTQWIGGEDAAVRARLASGLIMGMAIGRELSDGFSALTDEQRGRLRDRMAKALQGLIDG